MKNDQYAAVQRVLEMVRGEDGKFHLLLEYLGCRYLEARLESGQIGAGPPAGGRGRTWNGERSGPGLY